MQPKDRRLVTEQNLENYTELKIAPVRTSVNTATENSEGALSVAQQANLTSENAVDRVEQLEVVGGLAPGEVTDAQTANLFHQPTSLTRSAFGETMASEVSSDDSLGRAALSQVFTEKQQFRTVEHDLLVTVGDGGDFTTMNEAIEELSRNYPIYKPRGLSVELRLLTGFVMSEQVYVEQKDLGFITITSQDATVMIDTSSITHQDGSGDANAFTGRYNAVLPVISAQFYFDESATGAINGIGLRFHSSAVITEGAGITDAPLRGVNVQQNSRIAMYRSNFSRANQVGIRIANGSNAQLEEVIAKDSGYYGLSVTGGMAVAPRADFSGSRIGVSSQSGSTVSANDVNVSNCSEYGVEARQAATLNAPGVNAQGCGVAGVYAIDGSRINASNGVANDSGFGVHADQGSSVNAENLQASECETGVSVLNQSSVNASNATVDNSEVTGFRVYHGSYLNARWSKANNCGQYGLLAVNGCTVAADDLRASGAGTAGVRVEGSYVSLRNGQAQRGSSPDSSDISVNFGGTVAAHNAVGGSKPVNVLDRLGVVYQ